MNKSENITEITKALLNFQKEIGKIKKDAVNPFFKSNYATLSNILDAIEQPLQNNKLVVLQMPAENNGLTTILVHESGEYFESTGSMNLVKQDPQALGSAITYSRRYALGAILSLNIDEDDDGNAATTPHPSNHSEVVPLKSEDNPWLNKYTDKTESQETEQWKQAVQSIIDGMNPGDLRQQYKISKANFAELLSVLSINEGF